MPDDNTLDQSEIERLLSGGGRVVPESAAEPVPPVNEGSISQAELESLFGSLGGSAPASTEDSLPPAQTAIPAYSAIFPDSGPERSPSLDQSDIENLLRGTASRDSAVPPPPPVPPPQVVVTSSPPQNGRKMPHLGRLPFSATVSADEEGVPQGDIDYLLRRANEALDSISTEKMDLPNEVIEFQYPEFGGTIPNVEHATLDQISEVELDVKIELGRANMYLEDVLKLRKGSVVPLDKMAGDAVDIYVNNRLVARGEVLVMNENFCVRVAELLAGAIPME
jgi:flagellar motor switch protein FliN/FliY